MPPLSKTENCEYLKITSVPFFRRADSGLNEMFSTQYGARSHIANAVLDIINTHLHQGVISRVSSSFEGCFHP